jgi:hypothetical protein
MEFSALSLQSIKPAGQPGLRIPETGNRQALFQRLKELLRNGSALFLALLKTDFLSKAVGTPLKNTV